MLKHLLILACVSASYQRNFNISSVFDENDLKCLSNATVYYVNNQKCYNLLEKGPCSSQEWLVLENNSGRLRAVCKNCKCCKESSKKVFWVKDGQCHRTSDNVCPRGNKLINDFDGKGYCVCKDGFGRVLNSPMQDCFPLFERSTICPQGQYLVLTDNVTDENAARCVSNPCGQDGKAPWTEDNKFSLNRSHCYDINTQGPCTDPDQLFRVMPGDQTKVGCFSPAFSIIQVPTLCGRARNGQCKPPVTFEETSNRPMMSNKLQAFLQRNRIAGEEVTTQTPVTTTTRVQSTTSGGDMWAWGD